jgi:hypothetical protein
MANTYTLKDGTVLNLGDVYEATPEGYLRMVNHHVELFGMRQLPHHMKWIKANNGIGWTYIPLTSTYPQSAPFTIIWLPDQIDTNVVPHDEIASWYKQGKKAWYQDPVTDIWFDFLDLKDPSLIPILEWLKAKGVTFYKQPPEGIICG